MTREEMKEEIKKEFISYHSRKSVKTLLTP